MPVLVSKPWVVTQLVVRLEDRLSGVAVLQPGERGPEGGSWCRVASVGLEQAEGAAGYERVSARVEYAVSDDAADADWHAAETAEQKIAAALVGWSVFETPHLLQITRINRPPAAAGAESPKARSGALVAMGQAQRISGTG